MSWRYIGNFICAEVMDLAMQHCCAHCLSEAAKREREAKRTGMTPTEAERLQHRIRVASLVDCLACGTRLPEPRPSKLPSGALPVLLSEPLLFYVKKGR